MLEKEKQLGIKFEDDYKELYLTGEIGQKRFSSRWGVGGKSLIFGRNLRGGRRSWAQMLELPGYKNSDKNEKAVTSLACEICGKSNVTLENAHWIENSNQGEAKWYNIIKLCPNHHTQLDDSHRATTESVRAALLLRVVKKMLDSRKNEKELKAELLRRVEPIIMHRRKNP